MLAALLQAGQDCNVWEPAPVEYCPQAPPQLPHGGAIQIPELQICGNIHRRNNGGIHVLLGACLLEWHQATFGACQSSMEIQAGNASQVRTWWFWCWGPRRRWVTSSAKGLPCKRDGLIPAKGYSTFFELLKMWRKKEVLLLTRQVKILVGQKVLHREYWKSMIFW